MTPVHNFKLLNQTLVRFRSGVYEGVAYSNTVQTPLVGPILTAQKSAALSKLILNQTVTFTIVIGNTGNRPAAVTLVDVLPPGLSFIPNSVLLDGAPLPGASPASGIVIGSVTVGSTVQLIFQAIVISIPPAFTFQNEASLNYSFTTQDGRVVSDTVLSNRIILEVVPFLLNVHARLSTPVTFLGDVIFYDLVLHNEGLLPMENVVIHLPLPEGFTFIPGSVVIDGVLVPWIDPNNGIVIGYLAPGATVTVRVGIRLAQMPLDSEVTFQAIIDYTVNGTSYSTLANLLVLNVITPTLTVNLAVNHSQDTIGSTLTYTATVTNDSSFAVDAQLMNLLSPGTVFVPNSIVIGGVPRQGTSLGPGIPLGTLLAGSSTIVSYQVVVQKQQAAIEYGQIINQVQADYTYRLSDGRVIKQNALSNSVITIILAPKIKVMATAQPMYYEAEESVAFTILVQNTGNLAAEVTLFRTGYPQGFYLLDPQVDDIRVLGFTLEEGVYLGQLSPGATVRVTYWIYVSDSEEIQDETLTQVTTRYIARYHYYYEDNLYSDESLSNELTLPLDQNIE